MQNFAKLVQTPLSQKEKTFSVFFVPFLKYARDLQQFERKDEYPSLNISKIIDSQRGDYLNLQKALLHNTIQ